MSRLDAIADCRIPQIEDAEIHNKTYRHGDKLIIMCHEGFKIRYPDLYNVVSLCRDDGTWDNLPICQGGEQDDKPRYLQSSVVTVGTRPCPQLPLPGGTSVLMRLEQVEGKFCSMPGSVEAPLVYGLILTSIVVPTAVCPLPPMVSHGDFVCHPRPCERYNHGTVVEFYCDPGYSLTSDYKYITCQYGEWFPSYQVYCIKSEQTWPGTHETLLTTWKIVAFTATSVLLVLLLVILARMFQTKFKAHFPPRGPPRSSSSDPDFVVVDGVPVMLPSYDEAVSGGLSALGPGYLASVGQGCPLPVDDQSPPAYPGSGDTDTGPGESETWGSRSTSDSPDTIPSTAGEVASTSPGIDIADDQKQSLYEEPTCLGKSPQQRLALVVLVCGGSEEMPLLGKQRGLAFLPSCLRELFLLVAILKNNRTLLEGTGILVALYILA
ncbi:sushi domain-containing protein 4-like isoform 2 [Camelus ferus]|nr:sushi domain-containing protein 4-like isoform 2 [Camelus ferus]